MEYEEIIKQAQQAANDGKTEEAFSLYKEAINLEPQRVSAYYDIALLYHQQGDLDKAISYFEKASELEPEDASSFNNLAVLYYSKEMLEEAEKSFKKAIELESDYAEAIYGLGKVYQKQERIDKAIENFNKCLRVEPNNKKAKENLEKCLSEAGIDRTVVKKQKINIGFVSYWFERGQAYVTKAIRDIVAEEYNTFIFARSGGTPDKPLLKTKGEWDVPNLTTHNEYKIPKELLKRWITDNQLDIVFFNEEYDFDLVNMARNCGVKTMGIYYWELFNPQFVPACKELYDKIICPTEACYNKFKSMGLNNIEYVKWGVDLNQFKPIDRPENEKVRFFHPAGWGGMHARRGTQFVIDAFQKMDNSDAELLIHIQSGSGIQEDGNIKIIHGTVPRKELIKMYQESDIAVLPSKWEGLGLTFLEAMGCGLPIITVDAPPMNEFIKSGFNGFCCQVSDRKRYPNIYVEGVYPDIEDMAEKMNRLTDRELLASMRDNTIEYTKKEWDWQKNSKKFIEIIEELKRDNQKLKLNLGCGTDIQKDYINIDIRPLPGVDIVANVSCLPYLDNSVDKILANDILEHFPKNRTKSVLKEWSRVLRNKGIISIRCPDMRILSHALLSNQVSVDEFSRRIYGGQEYTGNFHYTGFDIPKLKNLLREVGVGKIIDINTYNGNLDISAQKTKLFHPNQSLKIILISKRFTNHPWGTGNFIHKSLTKMGHEVIDIDFVKDRKKLNELLKQDADLLISYKGSGVNPKLIEMVKCPTVLWYPDDVLSSQQAVNDMRTLGYAYDYVYYFDQAGIDILKKFGLRNPKFLPLATDPEVYAWKNIDEKKYDVSFVGNVYPNRRKLLDRLKSKFNVYETKAYMNEMVDIFNRSKIVLNLAVGKSGYPLRVFEALGCRSFLLTNEIDPKFRIFEDRKHLVYFTDDNIEELIEYYLEHDDEREAVAQNGYQEVIDNHTFEIRMSKVIKDIRVDTEQNFLKDKEESSSLTKHKLKPGLLKQTEDNEYIKINKLADLQDLNQLARKSVIERLLKMKSIIDQTGLPYSDHMQNHWLRLWEYSGAVIESYLDKRMRVLDAGGTGTIFSFYMAAEGCEVYTVDILEEKIENAKRLSQRLGLKMHHSVQSIANLNFPDCYFDAVYSICVIEHLPKEEQSIALKELSRVLKPGGILSLTFDYGINAKDNPILNAEEVITRLALPTGLKIVGNKKFYTESNDFGETNIDYTFGALFLRKSGKLELPNTRQIPMNALPEIKMSKDSNIKPMEEQVPNKIPIIFISIDSLRYDYLGYNNEKVETPTIDELARDSVVFTNATTVGVVTTVAHICMLTGNTAEKNGVLNLPNYNPRSKDVFTKLSEVDYKTKAFAMYGLILKYHYKNWNLDVNDQFEGAADFPEVHSKILEWLQNEDDKKFFLFLHYWKCHSPYGLKLDNVGENEYGAENIREIVRLIETGELSLEDVRDSYRRQIQSISEDHLKPIFNILKQKGIYDDSIIILTADHGEGLGHESYDLENYRNFTHNRINESVVRVPLVIKFPKSMRLKGKIEEKVTHLDILPTIYSLIPEVTFSPDEEKLDGRNLLPILKNKMKHFREDVVNEKDDVEVVKADDSEKIRKHLEDLGYL